MNIATVLTNGGRVDWSGGIVAFDRINALTEYCDLWTMVPNGLHQNKVTNSGFPSQHKGNPAYNPVTGDLAFQATDPSLGLTLEYKLLTNPGAGFHNNVWVLTSGGQLVQITAVGKTGGVLHPHFSNAGDKLIWAELIGAGQWVIRMKDLASGVIATFTPGRMQFYETHGFSPDDSKIIFTASPDSGDYFKNDIYTLDLTTGDLVCLTDPSLHQWDEHAHYTPDGTRIVFMSSMSAPPSGAANLKSEFWVMNADGTGKRQLTHFNTLGYPEYVGSGYATASDVSLSGDSFLGFVQDNPTMNRAGKVVLVSGY